MENNLIKRLLEAIPQPEYVNTLRKINQKSKRVRIPGFTKIEKAPIGIIANAAHTNEFFRMELLTELASTHLADNEINLSDDENMVMQKLPREKWLAAVAFFLLNNDSVAVSKAEKIFTTFEEGATAPATPLTPLEVEKNEKREIKFRQKYMNEHEKVIDLQIQVKESLKKIDSLELKITQQLAENHELADRIKNYEETIVQLRKTQEKLNANCSYLQAVNADLTQTKIKVWAPYCNDILEKFSDRLKLEFALDHNATYPDLFDQYDQIWLFPDVIPFGPFRNLQKWKRLYSDKIWIFSNAATLIVHARQVIEQLKERNQYGVQ